MDKPSALWLVAGSSLGLVVALVDSSAGWDDTGVTAAALAALCAGCAAARPSPAWVWAFAIGIWIPLLGVVRSANYGSVLAIGVALLAAYAGKGLRALLRR